MDRIHRPEEIPWIENAFIYPNQWAASLAEKETSSGGGGGGSQRSNPDDHGGGGLVSSSSEEKKTSSSSLAESLAQFFGDDSGPGLTKQEIQRLIRETNPDRLESFRVESISLIGQVADHGGGPLTRAPRHSIHSISHEEQQIAGPQQQTCPERPSSSSSPSSSGQQPQKNVSPPPPPLLVVEVFRPLSSPAAATSKKKINTKGSVPSPDQTFLVSGGHLLSDLRDAISCVSDVVPIGEFSRRPSEATKAATETTLGSGVMDSGSAFFFIERTLYNDLRRATAIDLSHPIREWAQKRSAAGGGGLEPLYAYPMDAMRIGDLNLRLGYPYLLVHQGACEHLIVFTDVRLAQASSSGGLAAAAPVLTATRIKPAKRCRACATHQARWAVYECLRLPWSPTFLCQLCFDLFCYDADGKPLGNFRAYPYLDQSAIR